MHFRLNEQLGNIKCPICEGFFKPKTCGFWRCEYQFVGSYSDYEEGKNIVYRWFNVAEIDKVPVKPDYLKRKLLDIKDEFEFIEESDAKVIKKKK